MKAIRCLMLCITLLFASAAFSQVSLKTNLIGDALLSPNLGLEVGVAPKWTIDVPASINAWTLSHERRWRHWYVQPGVRYWFCNRYAGHFVGAHIHGGQYNIGGLKNGIKFLGTDFSKLSDYRFQGWFAGGGISYGYAWILGKHFNLEAEIGIGYSYTHYDQFRCAGCGQKIQAGKHHNYVGPTKAAINIVYVL